MKRQRIIVYIAALFKSAFENVHILGLFGIIAAQTFFLLEIVEFVGFNTLRIIFSIVALTNFSLLLFSIFQNDWLRRGGEGAGGGGEWKKRTARGGGWGGQKKAQGGER